MTEEVQGQVDPDNRPADPLFVGDVTQSEMRRNQALSYAEHLNSGTVAAFIDDAVIIENYLKDGTTDNDDSIEDGSNGVDTPV